MAKGTVTIPGAEGEDDIQQPVEWRKVESSNVDYVGWDKVRNMYVIYKSGKTYAYLNVSRQRAVACVYAKSVGTYINQKIKPSFGVVTLG